MHTECLMHILNFLLIKPKCLITIKKNYHKHQHIHSQAHDPFYSINSNNKTLLKTHSVVNVYSLIGDAVCKL